MTIDKCSCQWCGSDIETCKGLGHNEWTKEEDLCYYRFCQSCDEMKMDMPVTFHFPPKAISWEMGNFLHGPHSPEGTDMPGYPFRPWEVVDSGIYSANVLTGNIEICDTIIRSLLQHGESDFYGFFHRDGFDSLSGLKWFFKNQLADKVISGTQGE